MKDFQIDPKDYRFGFTTTQNLKNRLNEKWLDDVRLVSVPLS